MGIRASETGVTLTIFQANGTPHSRYPDPITGEFAFYFSRRRPVDPTSNDPHLGSKDWLTDLIVVDNPIKLNSIIPTQSGIQLTSAASKQVLVRWDANGKQGTISGCLTIVTKHHPGGDKHFAEQVEVIDTSDIDDQGPFWKDWATAAQSLLTQAASPSGASSPQSAHPGGTPSK